MAAAFTAPTKLPLHASSILHAHLHFYRPIACTTSSPGTLREAYKSAKAAYKTAKRATIGVSACHLSELEATYRAAKAEYKALKRGQSEETEYLPEIPSRRWVTSRYPATPIYDEATSKAHGDLNQVEVCGGKSCKRLGADAVAAMMKLSAPVDKCMKRCGGVGPTIAVDGVPRKVNFRKAVGDAMRVGAD